MVNDEGSPLIPPPAVVRARLARVVREARLLRSLLRLSIAHDREIVKDAGETSPPMAKEC